MLRMRNSDVKLTSIIIIISSISSSRSRFTDAKNVAFQLHLSSYICTLLSRIGGIDCVIQGVCSQNWNWKLNKHHCVQMFCERLDFIRVFRNIIWSFLIACFVQQIIFSVSVFCSSQDVQTISELMQWVWCCSWYWLSAFSVYNMFLSLCNNS